MKNFNFFLFCSLLFFSLCLQGQTQTEGLISENGQLLNCVVDKYHEINMANDSVYRAKFEEQNTQIYNIIRHELRKRKEGKGDNNYRNNPQAPCLTGTDVNVLTIPLVVYVVHLSSEPNPGDGPSNPTDAQINDGIQHLNDAFRNVGVFAPHGHGANDGSNPDAALLESVDIEIQFCLAKRDINGNASFGIYRIQSDTYSDLDIGSEISAMKAFVESQVGAGLFPDSDYSGAWLFNELCDGASCGVAGYAGPSLGVLNEAGFWGSSTNNSKVHIHEFGHYLNVWHPWQGGCTNGDCLTDGDYVCDTPPDNSSGAVSCGNSANSCTTDLNSGPFTVEQDDMYENYMDYGFQNCQNTFTQGQKDRMRASLMSRYSLVESLGCIDPNMTEAGIKSVVYPSGGVCATSFSPIVDIANNGNSTLTTIQFSVTIDGGSAVTETQAVSIASGASAQVTLNSVSISGTGSHNIFIEITQINGGAADTYVRNNYYCQSFIYNLPTALDYCEDAEDGAIDSDFILHNPTNDGTFDIGTTTNCAATNGSNAIRHYARDGGTGSEDALLITVDLTGMTNASLSFDLSYKSTYSNRATTLDVGVSSDCGISYTSEYNKAQSALNTSSTGSDPDVNYVPLSCDDWRTETIDLTSYTGSVVTIRFELTLNGSWAQNLYLDNICVNTCPLFTPPAAACIPETSSTGMGSFFTGIGLVDFNTINNPSSYPSIDNPVNGYLDKTTICADATTLYEGETYPLTVEVLFNTASIKAWIDYNNDNSFDDATEMVMNVSGITNAAPAVVNVTIPDYSVKNTYLRMRVLEELGSITDACDDPTYGQAEDYMVFIKCSTPSDIYPTITANASTTKTANKECTDGNWTYYYNDNSTPADDTDDELLLMINKAGQNIGSIGDGTFAVSVGISSGAASAGGSTLITAPYVSNPMGWYVMNRYWDVVPNPQPSSPVTIRFPYQTQDLTDLLVDVPAITHTDLYFYHIEGSNSSNPDGNHGTTTSSEFTQYVNGSTASLTNWVYSSSGSHHFAEYQVSSFSGGGGGSGGQEGGALPVELLSFTGQLVKDAVHLKWETATELNNDFFTLERSIDGVNFEAINRVAGGGTSVAAQQYQYIDRNPENGVNYYRLSQTDFDGSTEFTGKIISIKYAKEGELLVYPNPTTSKLYIDLGKEVKTSLSYEIYDALGRIVLSNELQINDNDVSLIDVDVESLESGLYLIRLADGGIAKTAQFVKR